MDKTVQYLGFESHFKSFKINSINLLPFQLLLLSYRKVKASGNVIDYSFLISTLNRRLHSN